MTSPTQIKSVWLAAWLLGCGSAHSSGESAARDESVTLAATVYGAGEAAGYLRIIPEGEPVREWAPRDVVVVRDAPLDLSVVSALLSAGPQSGASHLSLRLNEKKIPNASVPDIYRSPELRAQDGKLVHVRIDESSVEIRPTSVPEAEALWARQRPTVGELQLDLSRRDWPTFEQLRHVDAPAFGVKAANLGELFQVLPEANRVSGFGIPVSVYEDAIGQNAVATEVARVIADSDLAADPALKTARLKELRRQVKSMPLPDGLLEQLAESATSAFGSAVMTQRLRFRSSTNAEDLTVFSGAGLYDSKSGCLADDFDDDDFGPSLCLTEERRQHVESDLEAWRQRLQQEPELTWIADVVGDLQSEITDEKSTASALKKVWASLWNDRAFDERDFYGLDHARVKMAVAVVLSEKDEQLEAVAFTNVRYRDAPPVYALVSQLGEIGVVRPVDPSAQAETRLFWRGDDDEVTGDVVVSPSSLVEAGTSLWASARLSELGRLLFRVQDYFETSVYPEQQRLALDIELKITSDDRLLIKQARPYLSELPPF